MGVGFRVGVIVFHDSEVLGVQLTDYNIQPIFKGAVNQPQPLLVHIKVEIRIAAPTVRCQISNYSAGNLPRVDYLLL